MPGWKKAVGIAVVVVVTLAILNRVMAASPAVAKAVQG
jgi:hypothetical protein